MVTNTSLLGVNVIFTAHTEIDSAMGISLEALHT